MPLAEAFQEYVFRGGLDTKTDKKVLQLPALRYLENGDLSEPGTIKKLNGYQEIGNATTSPPASALYHRGLKGVLFANDHVYEYSEETAQFVFPQTPWSGIEVGVLAQMTSEVLDDHLLVDRGNQTSMVDYARMGDYEVFVALGLTANKATIYWRDARGGATLHTTTVSSAAIVRAGMAGTRLYVFVAPSSGNNLKLWAWNTATPTTAPGSGGTTIASDYKDGKIDVHSTVGGSNCYVVYRNTSDKIKVLEVNGTPAVAASGVTSATANPNVCICVRRMPAAPNGVEVLWVDSAAGFSVVSFNSSLAEVARNVVDAALTTVNAIITGDGDASATQPLLYRVYLQQPSGSFFRVRHDVLQAGNGGAGGRSWDYVYNCALGHKAIEREASNFVGLVRPNNTDAALFECRFGIDDFDKSSNDVTAEPVASCRYATAAGFHGNDVIPNAFYDATDDAYYWVSTVKRNIRISTSPSTYSWDVVPIRGKTTFYKGRGVEAHGALQLPGRSSYVGISRGYPLADIGFVYAPVITSAAAGAGGSMTSSVNYVYAAFYEYTDRAGNVHRSRPSERVTVPMGAGDNKVDLQVMTPFVRAGVEPTIVLCRGVANSSVLREHMRSTGTDTATGVDVFAFADTTADSAMQSNRLLYTEGGAAENYPPPATYQFVSHQARLWCIDDETGQIWPSKRFMPEEGIAFSPEWAISTDQRSGKPKCLASFGTAIAVFWEDAIGFVYGEGPNDAAQGGSFSEVQIVSGAEVGCTNYRSIVETPVGLMFADPHRGIYLLPGPGAQPVYIGAPVEDYRSKTIVGAHVMRTKEIVRFTCSDGTMLDYHYQQNQWGVRVMTVPGENASLVDADVWNGLHTVVTSDAEVDRILASSFRDRTTYKPLKVHTPWIKLDGLQGFVRVWDVYILGERLDAHSLTVRVRYDYDDDGDLDTYTFNNATLANRVPYEVRIRMRKQTCRAFRLEIEDASDGSPSDYSGCSISSIRVRYGVKKRRAPLVRA